MAAKYLLSDLYVGNYRISQRYGANPSYYQKFGFPGHEGVDWAIPIGKKLLTPFTQNRILRAGWDPVYGYYVVIWDPVQRCAVWYCHLSGIWVAVGNLLPRGVGVGLTGNTGNSSGPHLHANFVETNAYGSRLNLNNGYRGFLNILDKNLVRWQLSQ